MSKDFLCELSYTFLQLLTRPICATENLFSRMHVRGDIVGPAVLFSESPTVLKYPPPTLGQHTVEILQQQLNYDDNRIKQLEQSKTIQQN